MTSAGVAAILGAGVDEEQVAGAELPRGRREVQNGGVVAGRDDRLEGEEVAAVGEEGGLERDLQLALGAPRLDQRDELGEAGASGLTGGPHPVELDRVLGTPHPDQRVAELDVGVRHRHLAEPPDLPVADPALQLRQRAGSLGHALAVALEPGPEQLFGCDRRDELDPALPRREGEDPARAFAVGQVEVLGVRAERVGAIAATGHRNLLARGDEDHAGVEIPGLRRRRTPPLDELADRRLTGAAALHPAILGARALGATGRRAGRPRRASSGRPPCRTRSRPPRARD